MKKHYIRYIENTFFLGLDLMSDNHLDARYVAKGHMIHSAFANIQL
jgi:hypothetical protein